MVWRYFQEGGRIDGDSVLPQFKVDVFTGGQTGFSHKSEARAGLDGVIWANAHGAALEVEVAGLESVPMVENDIVATGKFARKPGNAVNGFEDDSGNGCDDFAFAEGRAGPDGAIYAVVGDVFAGDWVNSFAEGGGFHEVAGAFEDAAMGKTVGNTSFCELFSECAMDVHCKTCGD